MKNRVLATLIIEDRGEIIVGRSKDNLHFISTELGNLEETKNNIRENILGRYNLNLENLFLFKKIYWKDENTKELVFIAKCCSDKHSKNIVKVKIEDLEKRIDGKTGIILLQDYKYYKEYKEQLSFNTFLAFQMTKDDMYPPEECYKPVTKEYVKSCWKKTIGIIKKRHDLNNIGLFCYIPFCLHACKYCCTYYCIPKNNKIVNEYLDYLYREIDYFKDSFKDVKFSSLYIGGGTPTYLTAEQIDQLLNKIKDSFDVSKSRQVMFEVAPATSTFEKLKILKKHNVNRITIGVQSMNEDVLKEQERFQTNEQVIRAFNDARKAGIEQINVDIIAGLKGETLQSFIKGMGGVIALKPDMVYIYPFDSCGSNFYREKNIVLSLKDLELRHQMAKEGRQMLSENSFNVIEHAFLGKSPEARNLQETDELGSNASILGMGVNARSHAFGTIYYGNYNHDIIQKGKIVSCFKGIKVDAKDEMIKYIISNLRSPNLELRFKQLFGKELREEFGEAVRKLNLAGKATFFGRNLKFNIENRKEQLIISKLFYKKNHLDELKKLYSKLFMPNVDYQKELDRAVDSIE